MPSDERITQCARDIQNFVYVGACIVAALAGAAWDWTADMIKRARANDLHDWDNEIDWDRDYWWKDEA